MRYKNNEKAKRCDCCGESFFGDETIKAELCFKCKDMVLCKGCFTYYQRDEVTDRLCIECKKEVENDRT